MPNSKEPKPEFEVGQILIRSWGTGKITKNRVCQVTKVTKLKIHMTSWVRFTYDIKYPNGATNTMESSTMFISFDTYRRRIQNRIQATNNTLNKQEKEYQDSLKMEEEAKKIFQK